MLKLVLETTGKTFFFVDVSLFKFPKWKNAFDKNIIGI
jgi:hypothetical protein